MEPQKNGYQEEDACLSIGEMECTSICWFQFVQFIRSRAQISRSRAIYLVLKSRSNSCTDMKAGIENEQP
jgi:hypothetical protein